MKHKITKDTMVIDRCMMLVSMVHPFTAIPQVVEIYSNHSAANVALVTWVSFMLIGFVFLAYAIAHRIIPMIINQILWFGIDFAVVLGILMYR